VSCFAVKAFPSGPAIAWTSGIARWSPGVAARVALLPPFLGAPALIRSGNGFWLSLGAGCAVTILLYLLLLWLAPRFTHPL
jgi:hypothetical protein